MAIFQVIDLIRREVIILVKPGFIPTLADIMKAEVGSIDEDDAGPVISGIRLEETFGQFGIEAVPQHLPFPVVATIAERETGVNRSLIAGEEVIGDGGAAILAVDADVERFLRMHPIVLASDANATGGGETGSPARGEVFHISRSVFFFIDILESIAPRHSLVLVFVNADRVAKQRLRVGHDRHIGHIGDGLAEEISAGDNCTGSFARLETPRPQDGGGGDA